MSSLYNSAETFVPEAKSHLLTRITILLPFLITSLAIVFSCLVNPFSASTTSKTRSDLKSESIALNEL